MNIRITETVKHLLIINLIVFLTFTFAFQLKNETILKIIDTFPLTNPLRSNFYLHQIITSMFTHFTMGHFFMNMLSLYFIGPTVETLLGRKKFLIAYFVSGLAASIVQVGFYFSISTNINFALLGASGAISGIFGVLAKYFPENKIMIFPIFIPIKLKYAFLGFCVFSVIAPFIGVLSGIGHYAHLGGAIAGYLIAIFWKKNQFKIN